MKNTALFFGICISAVLLSGCSSRSGLKTAGGGMVRNAVLVTENTDKALALELPLITDRKIRELAVEDWHFSGTGSCDVTYGGMTGGSAYKGYYYYFLHFSLLVPQEEKTDLTVDSVDLRADGEKIVYRPEMMRFVNAKAYFPEPPCAVNDALLYEEAPVLLKGILPDDPEDPEYFSLEVNRDCMIRDFRSVGILEIENTDICVNGRSFGPPGGGIEVRAGDEVEIRYNLSYADGAGPSSLVKTSWYLLYEEADGKKCMLEEPQGFMVFNVKDDQFIKSYIDSLITPEKTS